MSDISKKPNKLASAIYLLTSFFGDSEPLKWKLRDLASDLASLAFFLEDKNFGDFEKTCLEARSVSGELRNLLQLASGAGLVSGTNFEIVDKELANFGESLALPEGVSGREGRILISSKYFDIPEEKRLPPAETHHELEKDIPKQVEKLVLDEKARKGHFESSESEVEKDRTEFLPSIKQFSQSNQAYQSQKSLRDYGAVSVKKNSRQSVIINLLKRKKEIMIKDVSPLIRGCSEKTIQRELLSMVDAGVLRKIGEKRWSRYTLA